MVGKKLMRLVPAFDGRFEHAMERTLTPKAIVAVLQWSPNWSNVLLTAETLCCNHEPSTSRKQRSRPQFNQWRKWLLHRWLKNWVNVQRLFKILN